MGDTNQELIAAGDLQSLDADARRMFAILLRDVRAWRGAAQNIGAE